MFSSFVPPPPAAFPSFYAEAVHWPALPLSADGAAVAVPPQLPALLPVSMTVFCFARARFALRWPRASVNLCAARRSMLPMHPNVAPAIGLELDVEDGEVENYEV